MSGKITGQFTPGPWHVNPHRADRVMSIDDGICDCEGFSFSRRTDQENARLIAVAPELLEALIGMVDRADMMYGTEEAADPGSPDILAKAAIAKAEGRS